MKQSNLSNSQLSSISPKAANPISSQIQSHPPILLIQISLSRHSHDYLPGYLPPSMEGIKKAFSTAKSEGRVPLVAYTTAGYPTIDESASILLGLEAGGAEIIELGLPFTDPIADGPTIQVANTQALANGTSLKTCLKIVKDARSRGLKVPVLFMGYYNPLLAYGEERLLKDCKSVGVNGFIMVDLPPEEAVRFRGHCTTYGLSYVPLIAPATSEKRMKLLCGIADSFIYVVSRMGVTGATGVLSSGLPDLLDRVHKYSGGVAAAVGFGVSTREHFLEVGKVAEGVVIGSQIITTLKNAPEGQRAKAVEDYCYSITQHRKPQSSTNGQVNGTGTSIERGIADHISAKDASKQPSSEMNGVVHVDEVVDKQSGPGLADQLEALNKDEADVELIPSRFGEFGGQYVPESLMDCLAELEKGFNDAKNDPKFWEEFRSYYPYMGRPSSLHRAQRLTDHTRKDCKAGYGANLYLKREDLNHTGSHKINNAMGPGFSGETIREERNHCRDWRGTTWCRDRHNLCLLWHEMHSVHGRRRCPKTSSERFPNETSRRFSGGCGRRQQNSPRRRQRSTPEMGREIGHHTLRNRLSNRTPSLPDHGPDIPERHWQRDEGADARPRRQTA